MRTSKPGVPGGSQSFPEPGGDPSGRVVPTGSPLKGGTTPPGTTVTARSEDRSFRRNGNQLIQPRRRVVEAKR